MIIVAISGEANREPSNTRRSYFFSIEIAKYSVFISELKSTDPTRWR